MQKVRNSVALACLTFSERHILPQLVREGEHVTIRSVALDVASLSIESPTTVRNSPKGVA